MKKIIFGLLLAGCLFGQNTGQNVVNNLAVTSRTINSIITYTCDTVTCANGLAAAKLQNLGQTNHNVVVNITANASAANIVTCNMQGSIDGSNWYGIGIQNSELIPTGAGQFKCFGYGSYPYLRVSVTINAVMGSITFSVTYLGNSIPSNSLIDGSGLNMNLKWLHSSPMTTGGVTQVFLTGSAGLSINLYGLEIQSDNTGTVLDIFCSPNGGTGDFITYGLGLIPTAGPIIYQIGMRPLYTCQAGDSLAYQLTGTPVASMSYTYRYE